MESTSGESISELRKAEWRSRAFGAGFQNRGANGTMRSRRAEARSTTQVRSDLVSCRDADVTSGMLRIVHHTFCPASSAKGSRRLEEMAARCPVSRTMTEPIEGNPRRPQADPPTKVSLLEVAVWFPTSEIMVLSQQVLQVGTRVSPKWGSYRGESNRI